LQALEIKKVGTVLAGAMPWSIPEKTGIATKK
jgi:hypothetical protein